MIKIKYTIKGQYETFECIASYPTQERCVKGISKMIDICHVIGIELVEEQA